MNNYELGDKQVATPQPNGLKEKRKKVLQDVRNRRAKLYKRLRAEGKII